MWHAKAGRGCRTIIWVLAVIAALGGCEDDGSGGPDVAVGGATERHIGMNLEPPSEIAVGWSFVDLIKSARPWFSQPADGSAWEDGRPLSLTPEGWVASLLPGQVAGTLMNPRGAYPGGQYVLLYEGQGALALAIDATVTAEQPGRLLVNVVPAHGIFLQITQTNPANPIRNIRLVPLQFETTHLQNPFHPLFVQRLRPFKTLRFMDWQHTWETTVEHWADRPRVTDAFLWNSKGVALEYMIDLANAVDADPWFCMPHLATDDYVRQFATMVRDRLDNSLKVCIEYSNEVWNYIFPAAIHSALRGLELGLHDDAFVAGIRYYAQRSVEIFRIWEEVFGGRRRLVRVLSSQFYGPFVTQLILQWRQEADALGLNYYFGYVDPVSTRDLTVDQLMDALEAVIPLDGPRLEEHAAMARAAGLEIVAFEGGQHLVAQGPEIADDQLTAVLVATNRHPRMYDLYRQHLNVWRQAGGKRYLQYTYTGAFGNTGSWGALELQDQDLSTAPKYRALDDFR